MKSVALFSVCVLCAGLWATGENLLQNPGFEESACPETSNGGEWGWFKDGAVTTKGWKGGGNAGLAKAGSTMFKLPCPIYWMPCFDVVGKMGGTHGTWWKFRMARAFEQMRPPVKNFFNGMFAKRNPSDWLTFLDEPVDQAALDKTGKQLRNMWCTAGFLHAGGLTVWKDGTIAKLGEAPEKEVFRFVPVTVTCRDDGRTAWQPAAQAGTRFIFEITDEKAYPEAMAKALAELMFAL